MKESFPDKKNIELSQQQLENLIAIKIDPGITLKLLLSSVLDEKTVIRFLITDDFDLYISNDEHNVLARAINTNRENCLLGDGSFIVQDEEGGISKELLFFYSWGGETKIKYLKNVAEEKIKNFLKSNGIEINRITHE